jgi:hypothetical protein
MLKPQQSTEWDPMNRRWRAEVRERRFAALKAAPVGRPGAAGCDVE